MKNIILLFLVIVPTIINSQNFNTIVADDTSFTNKNKFLLSLGLNFFLVNDNDYFTKNQNLGLNVGFGYEYKLNNIVSLVTQIELIKYLLKANIDTSIKFPISSYHDSYTFSLTGGSIVAGTYFNIPYKKCKTLFSLKVSGFVDLFLLKKLIVSGKISTDTSPFAQKYETTYGGLIYINSFNYGIETEIRKDFIAIGSKFYLSNFIDKKFANKNLWPQFPNLIVYSKILF